MLVVRTSHILCSFIFTGSILSHFALAFSLNKHLDEFHGDINSIDIDDFEDAVIEDGLLSSEKSNELDDESIEINPPIVEDDTKDDDADFIDEDTKKILDEIESNESEENDDEDENVEVDIDWGIIKGEDSDDSEEEAVESGIKDVLFGGDIDIANDKDSSQSEEDKVNENGRDSDENDDGIDIEEDEMIIDNTTFEEPQLTWYEKVKRYFKKLGK